MTPAQKAALEALIGRALTLQEEVEITPLIQSGSTQAIADILSVGRTRPRRTQIGIGTILAAFQGIGGQFMDTLVTIGQTNRDIYWLIEGTIKRGVLDTGDAATRAGIEGLIAQPAMAPFVPGMNVLLAMGVQPDPVTHTQVGEALKGAE